MAQIHRLLEEIGFQKERLQMVNVSAAMGAQFADHAREFSEKIRELGPNPLKNSNELISNRDDTKKTEDFQISAQVSP